MKAVVCRKYNEPDVLYSFFAGLRKQNCLELVMPRGTAV